MNKYIIIIVLLIFGVLTINCSNDNSKKRVLALESIIKSAEVINTNLPVQLDGYNIIC